MREPEARPYSVARPSVTDRSQGWTDELDPVFEGGRGDRLRLLGYRRSLRCGQAGVLGGTTQRAHEALEVAVRGDVEPARSLGGLDAIGMRHAARGEHCLAHAEPDVGVARADPPLALEHIERLVLGAVAVQRRLVTVGSEPFEHRDPVPTLFVWYADGRERVQEPELLGVRCRRVHDVVVTIVLPQVRAPPPCPTQA